MFIKNDLLEQYEISAEHRNKTGALINAAVQMGAAAAQANETQCKELEDYAFGIEIGRASCRERV